MVGGKRVEVGVFASHEAAEVALEALVSEAYAAGATPQAGISLRRLGEMCLALRRREGLRSVSSEENRWKVHVETWELASVAASTLTRADVRSWVAGLARKGLATQTRKNALNLLRAVLEHGVELELLESNVARDIRVKDRGTTKERSTWLSLDEAERLIDAANDPAVTLAIFTGLRLGELRSLEWADVHETEILVRYGAPGKPTKNGLTRRVQILPQAREALDAMPRIGPLVFPGRSPDEHRYRLVSSKDWKQWLVDAEIGRHVRWHDLRHTCATLLLSGALGVAWSTEAVREHLGHSSVTVTERYAHAIGTVSGRAAETMREASKARHKPGTCSGRASQVLETIKAPPTRIELVTFGLGNSTKPKDRGGLPHIPGSTRAYAVRALEAVRDESPTALALCVEALAALLEQDPARAARRGS